jgi:glucans biosynthesis protein C
MQLTMQQKPGDYSRLHYFDNLRAVTILSVVLFHCMLSYTVIDISAYWPHKQNDTHFVFDGITCINHLYQMPVFLFMSGFFASKMIQKRGLKYFIQNRLLRIGLPFVTGLIIFVPLVRISFLYANGCGADKLLTRFLAKPDPATIHLWFLYYLLIFSVFISITIQLFRYFKPGKIIGQHCNLSLKWHHWSFIVAIALFLLNSLNKNGQLYASYSFIPDLIILCAYFMFFIWGYFFYNSDTKPEFSGKLIWLHALVVILIVSLHLFLMDAINHSADEISRGEILMASLSGSVSMVGTTGLIIKVFALKFNRYIHVLKEISNSSYWIYIIHLPLVVLFTALLSETEIPVFFKIIINFSITITFCFLSYHYIVRKTVLVKIMG